MSPVAGDDAPPRRGGLVVLGCALILIPAGALALMELAPGMGIGFLLLVTVWLWLPAWIFGAVMAVTGCFAADAIFLFGRARSLRAQIAGWCHIVLTLAGFGLYVNGPTPERSTSPLGEILRLPDHVVSGLGDVAFVCWAVALACYVWLAAEWGEGRRLRGAGRRRP